MLWCCYRPLLGAPPAHPLCHITPSLHAARKTLAERKGEAATHAWNISYSLAGDVEKVCGWAGPCLLFLAGAALCSAVLLSEFLRSLWGQRPQLSPCHSGG